MEIFKSIVLVLHLLSFGALLGVVIAQFKPAAQGAGKISKGMLHTSLALLLTGLLLVGLTYAVGNEPNNLKIAVKTAVLLVIFALVIMGRNKERVTTGYFGAIAALLAVNVALAVMW
ncbi:hypothetical protein EII31_03540 [Leucobacter sp. OH2974_COT-288]|uniref:Uncharacterized membrane protein YidH (DUF202 family) n=1 Tax=Canibacter oris TaxID=1365628 RepID=A0A840DCT1_9MICO|nr:hypothetical protein [Canibacter oris]MBB4071271.1 uncharacterized membrane protein YidH (DUF202 family) [Canibacter oris]RRD36645.1 hypothetical protein EII31_03540 [Leucobacter sp. OH2974_COT-288]